MVCLHLLYGTNKVKNSFCSRDRLGIKPFYWTIFKEKFIFASEIKSILKFKNLKPYLNFEGLNEYLNFQFCLEKNTLFKNIQNLMPATNLIIKNRKFIFEKYWSENFDLDFNKNSKEFEDELAYLVNDSIKMQLRSDVPIGAHLSGGIDSSIVSMIASKYSENNFHTFSGDLPRR